MAIVQIRLNNRQYDIACDDGQEDHLKSLARELDDRMKSLIRAMGSSPGDTMALVLTSLTMADELLEHKKENKKIAQEVKRLSSTVNPDQKLEQEERMLEIENAMATTLEEIAVRIEKIAQQIEVS
jgi:cell division protein ZapA